MAKGRKGKGLLRSGAVRPKLVAALRTPTPAAIRVALSAMKNLTPAEVYRTAYRDGYRAGTLAQLNVEATRRSANGRYASQFTYRRDAGDEVRDRHAAILRAAHVTVMSVPPPLSYNAGHRRWCPHNLAPLVFAKLVPDGNPDRGYSAENIRKVLSDPRRWRKIQEDAKRF